MKLTGYFSKGEIALWSGSVLLILTAYCIFDRSSILTLAASLIGVTSLIFAAKGNPVSQMLIILFSLLYGYLSFQVAYYGEMLTYLGMTMPMAAASLIAWLRHPFQGSHAQVEVNSHLSGTVRGGIGGLTLLVTVVFFFVLRFFHTANLLPSTFSVTTSFLAVCLTFYRSPCFALAYAGNDAVLLVLWGMAAMEDRRSLSLFACFLAFLVNDIYGFFSWRKMQQQQKSRN